MVRFPSFSWLNNIPLCGCIYIYIYENNKKAGIAIFILDKTYFKTKAIKKDKEGYSIMIKRSKQEKDITLVNIYAPNIGALKYIKQILTDIKVETDNNII